MNPANASNLGAQPLRYPNIVGKRNGNHNEQLSDANLPLQSQRNESSYAPHGAHMINALAGEQHQSNQ